MKNEFDRILKKLVSRMPVHPAKTDTWQKINTSLDENISMARIREKLNEKEYVPKSGLWDNIETKLNIFDLRRQFFINFFYISLLSLFIVTSGTLLYFLFHKNSGSLKAFNTNRSKKEIFSHRQNIDQDKNYMLAHYSFMNKNNSGLIDQSINENKQESNFALVGKKSTKQPKNYKQIKNEDSILAEAGSDLASEKNQKNNDSSERFVPSVDFDQIKFIANANSISGKINWDMTANGNISLYVYDENGKLIKKIFDKKKFDIGEQSYNFKLVDCQIEKNKKYFLRLISRKVVIKEIECIAE